MSWPQILVVILLGFGIGGSVANRGKPRSNEDVLITLIGSAIIAALLWWGGFWS